MGNREGHGSCFFHASQALKIATRLEEYSAVEAVRYPFLTSHPNYVLAKKQMAMGVGIVSFEIFEIKGGVEAGKRFFDGLKLFSLAANLGDTRSIATHSASTNHSKLKPEERANVGISNGLIHLSIGL